MEEITSNIKKEGINLIHTRPEISSLVFFEFLNEPLTFRCLNPDKYEEARKAENRGKKSLNTPLINECFKSWKEAGFLELGKIIRERKGKRNKKGEYTKNNIEVDVYRLNLEPLFYLFEEKFSHFGDISGEYIEEKFAQKEKNILNFFFNSDIFRSMILKDTKRKLKFLEDIPKLYLSWLYIPYLEHIAHKNKFSFKKKLKNKVSFPESLLKKIVNYKGKEIASFMEIEVSKLSYKKAIPYFLYNGHYEIKSFPDPIDNAQDFLLIYYSQLKKLFPRIMGKLDRKINMMLFLETEGIIWDD